MNTTQKVIKVKVGLLELAKQLGNVSQAPDHKLERHLASLPSFRSALLLGLRGLFPTGSGKWDGLSLCQTV